MFIFNLTPNFPTISHIRMKDLLQYGNLVWILIMENSTVSLRFSRKHKLSEYNKTLTMFALFLF